MSANFTPLGQKVYQPYENDRNMGQEALIEDIVREVFGARKCIVGHHIVFQVDELRHDEKLGHTYTYPVTQEMPCMDSLIFDHHVAAKVWGDDFRDILAALAVLDVEARDARLKALYYGRKCIGNAAQK